ncbi:hypothetical protein F5Y14DRAFT_117304 [Nemania sp. NC0429]|nr:hypothetical protein F5Y14DRAFT_117304 [Nemania sp. NC0429]
MAPAGGYYRFRCKSFLTHGCSNWVYINNASCAQCTAALNLDDADQGPSRPSRTIEANESFVDWLRKRAGKSTAVKTDADDQDNASLASKALNSKNRRSLAVDATPAEADDARPQFEVQTNWDAVDADQLFSELDKLEDVDNGEDTEACIHRKNARVDVEIENNWQGPGPMLASIGQPVDGNRGPKSESSSDAKIPKLDRNMMDAYSDELYPPAFSTTSASISPETQLALSPSDEPYDRPLVSSMLDIESPSTTTTRQVTPSMLDVESRLPTPPRTRPSLVAPTSGAASRQRPNGLRKKSARFAIPAERNLDNIDALIAQATDDDEIRELKRVKRLLRNRQAALDSRQRKKLHTEQLEEEKRHYARLSESLDADWREFAFGEHSVAPIPRGPGRPNTYQSPQNLPGTKLPRSINADSSAEEWHVEGEVNGFLIEALADTGASINAMSRSEADRIGLIPEPGGAGKKIRLPSGKTCRSLGTANLRFNFQGEDAVHALRCNIVDGLEYGMIVCYDFLTKTETLTRFFKTRIKEVARSCLRRFPLCLMEDISASSDTRARMDGRINGASARVVPDTGSGIMAVSAAYARRLGLPVDTTRRTKVVFADGSSATTSGIVRAIWSFLPPDPETELRACLDDGGQAASSDGAKRLVRSSDAQSMDAIEDEGNAWDYDWEYEWHVIEDLPVDAILSLDFIKRHDVFARHQHAFVHAPPPLTLAEMFGICELPGGSRELKNLAGEFLADLNSSDPFTHAMIARESARQCEIGRRIMELPPAVQETQRAIEQARIDSWRRIAAAREKGQDWTRLRSDYVQGLHLQPAQLSWPQNPTETPVALNCQDKQRGRGGLWRWRSRGQ